MELSIGLAIVTVLMLSVTSAVQREAGSLSSTIRRTDVERRARTMIDRIEAELEYAQAASPTAWLTAALGSGGGEVEVSDVRGFPDRGTLLIGAGTAGEERLDYRALASGPDRFATLARGAQCTAATAHAEGDAVLWAGMATALDDQTAPPAAQWDGISREQNGQVFFRGDGSGFSYRVPTDADGDGDVFDGETITWGAVVAGTPTNDGWTAVYFEPAAVISELARGFDLNGDGDLDDVFDLGRIRLRSWDIFTGDASDVALSTPVALQEQCNWGGDLDADGFADPIFLWMPNSGRLRIRLFLLTTGEHERSEVRTIEAVHFLRNGLRQ
jgi:hypothetical protein